MQKMFLIITSLVLGITAAMPVSAQVLEETMVAEKTAIETVEQGIPLTEEIVSEYLRGTVQEIIIDENGRTLYVTQLENGERVNVDTYGENISVGSKIFIENFPNEDYFNYVTVDRSTPILLLLVIFVVGILVLAGKKGVRSLVSLLLSFVLLFVVLVPVLVAGWPPRITTLIFGLAVLSLSIFVTHGFNRQSLVSFLGSVGSIVVAFVLLEIVSAMVPLSGLINDHIQYLDFEVEKVLDLVGIVSAGIIIGILGILDDITITQVAVVRELSSDPQLTKMDIFKKALRVGRDHITSLVNTLVFAYIGATLPLVMFISLLDIPFMILIGQEFIFIEIIRSLVGAIALIVAVPLTTYLAVFMFLSAIHRDNCAVESACAHHHHH